MGMTWGDIKAKVEAEGVTDDMEVADLFVCECDKEIDVCIEDDEARVFGFDPDEEDEEDDDDDEDEVEKVV